MRSGSIFDHCSFGEFTFNSKMWITDSSRTFSVKLRPTYVYSTSAIVAPVTSSQYALSNMRLQDFTVQLSLLHPPVFMREEPDMHVFRLRHNTALPLGLKRGSRYLFFSTINSRHAFKLACVHHVNVCM